MENRQADREPGLCPLPACGRCPGMLAHAIDICITPNRRFVNVL